MQKEGVNKKGSYFLQAAIGLISTASLLYFFNQNEAEVDKGHRDYDAEIDVEGDVILIGVYFLDNEEVFDAVFDHDKFQET